jgi:hypothetical protein
MGFDRTHNPRKLSLPIPSTTICENAMAHKTDKSSKYTVLEAPPIFLAGISIPIHGKNKYACIWTARYHSGGEMVYKVKSLRLWANAK